MVYIAGNVPRVNRERKDFFKYSFLKRNAPEDVERMIPSLF